MISLSWSVRNSRETAKLRGKS